jgi:hypothetical protein
MCCQEGKAADWKKRDYTGEEEEGLHWCVLAATPQRTPGKQKKKRGYTGVFKRLRRNGHLESEKKKRGYTGVFKRLRRNGHWKEEEGLHWCVQTAMPQRHLERRRGVTLVCSSGYAATDTWKAEEEEGLHWCAQAATPQRTPGKQRAEETAWQHCFALRGSATLRL